MSYVHVIVTNRDLALCGAMGSFLAAVGGLYLSYEILGGQNGPLNLLTRTVSYSLMFIACYTLFFPLEFAAIAGVGLGVMLSLEHVRIARHQRKYGSSPLHHLPSFGAIRGGVIALAATPIYGNKFGLVWGGLSAAGLYMVYKHGYAPTYDYRAHSRPVLSRHRLMASIWRGVVIGAAGTLAALLQMRTLYSIVFGLYVGFAAGSVSFIVSTVSPFIEYWADNLPGRRLAAIGAIVMIFGMVLQTARDLLVLIHIPVH